jgi:hypothetical protein
MSTEVVLYQHDLSCLGEVRISQVLKDLSIVHSGMAVGNLHLLPALQRGEHHEQIGGAVARVLVVVPDGVARFCRDRHPRLADQLL